MSTTDTDPLREKLAETLHYGQGHDDWGVANDDERGEALALADEVLPTVRAAQHAAWVQGAARLDETGYYSLAQLESFSPYREETPDEQ